MHQARPSRIAAVVLAIARGLAGQTSGCEDLSPLDVVLPNALATMQVPGLAMHVTKSGLVRYERAFGSYTVDEVVPIASGSKWLSAACVLTLVDQGKLALDDKVSKFLP